MKFKQVKSSERERERERESRNYANISLQQIEKDVASLSGRATTTPISMSALYDEVQKLKSTMKQWEIVTLNKSGNYSYSFDSKYADYDFIVLNFSASWRIDGRSYSYTRNNNNNNFYADSRTSGNIGFTKSGNTLNLTDKYPDSISSTITVLFYK